MKNLRYILETFIEKIRQHLICFFSFGLFYNNKEYHDLEKRELNRKNNIIVYNLAKMKVYGIDDKNTYNYYYDELVNTNKSIKWSDSNKNTKRYKLLGKNYIRLKSLEYYVYYKMNGKL